MSLGAGALHLPPPRVPRSRRCGGCASSPRSMPLRTQRLLPPAAAPCLSRDLLSPRFRSPVLLILAFHLHTFFLSVLTFHPPSPLTTPKRRARCPERSGHPPLTQDQLSQVTRVSFSHPKALARVKAEPTQQLARPAQERALSPQGSAALPGLAAAGPRPSWAAWRTLARKSLGSARPAAEAPALAHVVNDAQRWVTEAPKCSNSLPETRERL